MVPGPIRRHRRRRLSPTRAGAGVGISAGLMLGMALLGLYTVAKDASQPLTATASLPAAAPALEIDARSLGRQLVSRLSNALISRAEADDTVNATAGSLGSDQQRNAEQRPIAPEELLAQATFLFMMRPEDTLLRMQRLGQNPTLLALFNEPANQRVLDHGTPIDIEKLSDFQTLRQDPDMQTLFSRDYLSDRQLATLVSTYWKRNKSLQHKPEIQRLLRDPELKALLDSGNLLALIAHPKGRQLINAYLYPTTPEEPSLAPNRSSTATDAQAPSLSPRHGADGTAGSDPEFAGDDIFHAADDTAPGRR